jgi:hypothetical protein
VVTGKLGSISGCMAHFFLTSLLAISAFGATAWAEIPDEWPMFTEEVCEQEWPSAEATTRTDAELCVRYWLKRYVYGNTEIESIGVSPDFPTEWIDIGHYNGLEVETRVTTEQFRQMIRHVQAALTENNVARRLGERAVEYFEGAIQAQYTLRGLSSMPIPSILPQLDKALSGKRLVPEDLHCRSEATLWKIEGAIYARHGAPFSNSNLDTFFYGPRTQALRLPIRTRLLPRRKNAAYSPEQLSDIDQYNLAFIDKVRSMDTLTRCKPIDTWAIAALY